MHHLAPLLISSFLSLLPLILFVYSWQKGGEYTREYTGLYCHFYMTHVHTLRGSNSTSCTFVGGESHRGDAYTKGEKTIFLRKPCFYLLYIMLVFSLFMVLWVTLSTYALLHSSHHAFVLDMHSSLCYCALLVACSDDHLLCHMIIVVILSYDYFGVWLSCSHVSHHVYLITIYLLNYTYPFYHLIYLKGLMCFVQVFQATSIYVPSATQFLDLGVSEFYHCSQTHV